MKSTRRFPVLTFGLSPDLKRVHPAFGKINRGDVSRRRLLEVLEFYRKLETDAEPSASWFVIEGEMGRFVIRAVDKQLTLGLEGDPPAQRVPLTTEQILARIEEVPAISVAPKRPPAEPWSRSVITLVLLCAGVALMVHALKPLVVPARPRVANDVEIVIDPADYRTRLGAVTGTFATGDQAGDRHLTVAVNEHVVFVEIGPRQSLGSGADSFRIGRRDQRTCLVTPRSGVIEVVDANTLLYFGDTYRRIN